MKIHFKDWNKWRIALWIFIAHTFLFIIQVPQLYLYNLHTPQAPDIWLSIARLTWGVYLWAMLTPLILWLGYRFPIARRHLWRNLFFHVFFGLASAVIHHYGYYSGLLALNLTTAEAFRANLFVLNYFTISTMRYAAVIGVQHAYFYFRESQERAFLLQQAELSALQAQLHPHFFFNTLNALSALIYRSPKEADRMITRLGDLFRILLKKDKSQEISLKEELEFLEAYLQIHQTLMGERLKVEWRIEPETLNSKVPNLILQTLVENSVKHGLAPLEEGGRIEIGASRQNGHLRLEVKDSGIGIKAGQIAFNEGIGIENTRARLRYLYGEAQDFKVNQPTEGGTCVSIKIPLRNVE